MLFDLLQELQRGCCSTLTWINCKQMHFNSHTYAQRTKAWLFWFCVYTLQCYHSNIQRISMLLPWYSHHTPMCFRIVIIEFHSLFSLLPFIISLLIGVCNILLAVACFQRRSNPSRTNELFKTFARFVSLLPSLSSPLIQWHFNYWHYNILDLFIITRINWSHLSIKFPIRIHLLGRKLD